jgi:uncharacterized phage protein (TIGR01671 family)
MNRIIKFRVWDTYKKRFFTDKNYTSATIDDEMELNDKWSTVYGAFFDCLFILNGRGGWNPERFVTQQFTGMKDENGKEIFEGDIVKYQYYIRKHDSYDFSGGKKDILAEVKIDKDCFGAYYPFSLAIDGEYGISDTEPQNTKIVGNIYENPELLNLTNTKQ